MSTETISQTTIRALLATERGLYDVGTGRLVLNDRPVTSVALDGAVVYALVDGVELHRIDGDRVDRIARLTDGAGTAIHVYRGALWIGGTSAGLWRLDGTELTPVDSFLTAPTRPEWSAPWGGPPAVYSFASRGDDLYVSVHVGGIMRTSDQGRTWEATSDLHDDVHQVTAGPNGTLWAATGRRGLASSTDRGRTWSYHRDGLHATYLLTVAATGDQVLVGASSGPRASDGVIYRFDGEAFEPVGRPLPDELHGAVGPRRLAAAGHHAAVATPDGSLYVSTDGGHSWHRHLDDLDRVTEIAVAAPS